MSYELASVVLPVYRQADHIDGIVRSHAEALGKLPIPFELVVVVNGPRDGTLEACESLARELGEVRVTENAERGWARAVKRGLSESRGDLLCFTNSARTASQDLVLLLLYAIAYPGVVVKAQRRVRDSMFRRMGSLLYNLECRMLFDLAVFDVNGTPKVFPRSMDALLQLSREDDVIDAEFNVVCRRLGYPVIEVPIVSTRRHGGRSTTTTRSAVAMYAGALNLWRQRR